MRENTEGGGDGGGGGCKFTTRSKRRMGLGFSLKFSILSSLQFHSHFYNPRSCTAEGKQVERDDRFGHPLHSTFVLPSSSSLTIIFYSCLSQTWVFTWIPTKMIRYLVEFVDISWDYLPTWRAKWIRKTNFVLFVLTWLKNGKNELEFVPTLVAWRSECVVLQKIAPKDQIY